MVRPDQKRAAVKHLQSVVLDGQTQPLSQRAACAILKVERALVRKVPTQNQKDAPLKQQLATLSQQNPRYGYRRIHALVIGADTGKGIGADTGKGIGTDTGKRVNKKRVHRLWKAMQRQVVPRKKRRPRGAKAQSEALVALYPGHIWSYDFVFDHLRNGTQVKLLCLNDEFTRQCHAIEVGASLPAGEVKRVLEREFQKHGAPRFLRSDNGPEFKENGLQNWLQSQNVQPLYIEPGSPWQNGREESMHGKLRDECLDGELFGHRLETQVVVEGYRQHFNAHRPHSALGYQTPNQFAQNWTQNQKTLT